MLIQFKTNEVLVLLAASIMSLLANLPDSILGGLVDKKMLLAALTSLVIVAMFRYLQMLLLLTISILAIGANLPAELAASLGISQLALIISLGFLIAISLLNRAVKLLPVEEETPATEIADRRETMLAAIAKGNQAALQRLLVMNENVNFTLNGTTPLHLAAEKGYPEIVRILISYGADYRKKNAAGKTPMEIAQEKKKFIQTEEILHNANRPMALNPAETRRADHELWRNQHGR